MKELEFDFLVVGQWQDRKDTLNFNLYGLESKIQERYLEF